MKLLKNIIDYVETEFRTFDEEPLNSVDSLILSQFAYIHLDGIVPFAPESSGIIPLSGCYLAEHFDDMFRDIREPALNRALLSALAASPRFRNISLSSYVSEFDPGLEKQFSALTYILPDKSVYVAFRGTDDTIIGWKEDFNIAFVYPVPSQIRASEYLIDAAARFSGKITVGGHSKGGNLAVYSAFTAPRNIQDRIVRVFDHDGPGFRDGVLDCGGYKNIESKILKTIPQSSLIGMLLEGHKNYTVVESSRIGVMQHDPFSWKLGDSGFITVEEVSDGAKYLNRTIRDWINSLTDENREKFTDILFGVLDAGDAVTFAEITSEWRKNYRVIFSAIRETDPEMKKFIWELTKNFGSLMFQNLRRKKIS